MLGVSQAALENCTVCQSSGASYRCPRCGISYCGIQCYRQHGGGSCTEAFFKEQVEEELKAREKEKIQKDAVESSQDSQRLFTVSKDRARERLAVEGAFAKVLANGATDANEDKSCDRDDDNSAGNLDELEERLKQVLNVSELSEEAIAKASVSELEAAMTGEDLSSFHAQLTSSGVFSINEQHRPYIPWWTFSLPEYTKVRQTRVSKRLVWDMGNEELNVDSSNYWRAPAVWFGHDMSQDDRAETFRKSRDDTLASIGAPAHISPSFVFHVSSVLLSYVHVLRLFNGHWSTENREDVLRELANYSSILRGERFSPEVMEQVLLDFGAHYQGLAKRENIASTIARRVPSAQFLMKEEDRYEGNVPAPLFANFEQQLVDVQALWQYPGDFVVDALLDLWWTFNQAPQQSRIVKQVEKKLWFMVVWSQTNDAEINIF